MDENVLDELLDAILPTLASAETQSAAVLEALKQSGVVTEEQLAPFLEQASNAAENKTRATRVRLKRLLKSAVSDSEEKKPKAEPETKPDDPEAKKESPGQQTTADQPENYESKRDASSAPASPPTKEPVANVGANKEKSDEAA